MYFQKKAEFLKGRGGSRLWNSEGMGGNAFWNFRRQGGVKTWKPSVVGYGYFLELPSGSLSDVFVDFYSGCTKSTIALGKEAVHSALFLTSNEVVNGTAR